MVLLTPQQEYNYRAALSVTDNPGQQVRLVFAILTESRGLVHANGGLNTSKSPGFDTHPEWPAILRRSLLIRHDAIGNNGRSTGMLQQISDDVGGVWGSMTGTMDPAMSARRFLAALRITGNANYTGTLLTPTGSRRVTVQLSDPIAADVLRVQQPLADEALSSNYDASQVQIARAIVAQLTTPKQEEDWLQMVTREEYVQVNRDLVADLKDGAGHSGRDLAERTDALASTLAQIKANTDLLVTWGRGDVNKSIDGLAEVRGAVAEILARLDKLEQ